MLRQCKKVFSSFRSSLDYIDFPSLPSIHEKVEDFLEPPADSPPLQGMVLRDQIRSHVHCQGQSHSQLLRNQVTHFQACHIYITEEEDDFLQKKGGGFLTGV